MIRVIFVEDTSHKDHLEACLPIIRLLSDLYEIWSSMKITLRKVNRPLNNLTITQIKIFASFTIHVVSDIFFLLFFHLMADFLKCL